MNTKKIVPILMILSFLVSVLTFATQISPASATSTTLIVNPTPVQKAPGDLDSFFNVSVAIQSVTDLFGFDINMTWDNTLITCSQLYYNDSLGTVWPHGYYLPFWPPENGTGWIKFVAVAEGAGNGFNGTGTVFKLKFEVIRFCNAIALSTPIHFQAVKLSDSQAKPITATMTDGLYQMSAQVPDLEFAVSDPNPSKPFEYGKTFYVSVKITNCVDLEDYNFTILYDNTLLTSEGVYSWGVLGSTHTHFDNSTLGKIHVWDTGDGTVWSGNSGLLLNIAFHVEFDDRPSHIWRVATAPNTLTAQVSFQNASLSFIEGTIPMSGITMPSALPVTVHLIQGDVDCNGKVNVLDLQTVAHYYLVGQGNPLWAQASKYNLIDPSGDPNIIDLFDLDIVANNFGYGTAQ